MLNCRFGLVSGKTFELDFEVSLLNGIYECMKEGKNYCVKHSSGVLINGKSIEYVEVIEGLGND